jgi:thiomorpholine-carboxylate dehydrogenase
MPLYFTESDVRAVLTMPDLIRTMESALHDFSTGKVQQPVRTVLDVGGRGVLGLMPAYVTTSEAVGAKLVTVFHDNKNRGLPSHLATILLFDPHTGEPLAILDGRYITEARTAAVSAVSAKLLAREGAGVLAILGSGVQARSHAEALACVCKLREIRAWSPNADNLRKFAGEYDAVAAESAEEAVRGADLIVLATNSAEPVIESGWIAPGAHIMAVGACRPNQREMEGALVARGRLFVDSRTAALKESGDVLLAIRDGLISEDHIAGELGELIHGAVAGRESEAQITVFKSLGLAVEDVTAAQLAYDRTVGQASRPVKQG